MNETVVRFDCHGDRLIGILHQPTSAQKKIGVIIVVGGPQYRVGSHRQFTIMARTLAEAGFPTLRFDYRGMGDSQGDFQGFEKIDEDIKSAIDALLKNFSGLNGVILWGLCDAASACLIYSNKNDTRVKGMILANPWVRTASGEAKVYLKYYYFQRFIQKSFWQKILTGSVPIKKSISDFIMVIKKSNSKVTNDFPKKGSYLSRMFSGLELFRLPILILTSDHDLIASEFNEVVEKNKFFKREINSERVSRIRIENGDHTFSNHNILRKVSVSCVEWINSYF